VIARGTEIAVNGDNLLIWNAKDEHAVNIPRFVPVAISVEGPPLQAASALNRIYSYLYDSGALSTGNITAANNYDSLRQWLLELQVTFPLGRISKEDKKTADFIEADLGRLLCELNSNICKDGTALSLDARIRTGSVMTFPFVTKRAHTVVRERRLNGSTLDDVVAQAAPTGTYSSWYLADLNENNLPTLEATLDRERYLMLTPFRSDLKVGSVVRSVGGEERLVATGGDCFSTEKIPFPVELPSTATTGAGIEVLPRYFIGSRGVARQGPDISAIEVKIDNPIIERVAQEKLSDRQAHCIATVSSIGNDPVFVVTSVLKASSLRYRLINKKHKVLHPTVSQLRNWGLVGTPDTSDSWSVVVNGTYAIAYQASVPLLEADPIRWQTVTDPWTIKRGSSQDIRSRNEGQFRIPVITWQLDVLLPQRDLSTEGSSLSKITADAPGVYVLPVTRLTAYVQSIGATQPIEPPTIDNVKENRSNLLNAIHWPTEQPILRALSAQRITLAIGEHDSETNSWRWLPEFVEPDGRTNVFRDVTDTGLIPLAKPANVAILPGGHYSVHPKKIGDRDHGAYVAGLIAGRDRDVPGLLPNAGLFLVNLSQANSRILNDAIDDANTNNISVLNLSQVIAVNNDRGLLDLKKKLKMDEWRERLLFVTAAGNNDGDKSGEDVELFGDYAFISWVSYSPQNVIGVAASDPKDDHLLKHCKPDDDSTEEQACSNFSKKYVQLTAPGYRVYALGAGTEYLLGSGTSVAVPQVAAAAAMLKAMNPLLKPYQIKARLIYTADYNEDYIGDSSVWGGRLNVDRALSEPEAYVIKTNGIDSHVYRVDIDQNSLISGLHTGEVYDPDVADDRPPDSITVGQILRLHQTDQGFWIVYLDRKSPWRMKMVVHADLSADAQGRSITIPCSRMFEWNNQTNTWDEMKSHDWLVNGVPMNKVLEFVGPIPVSVTLPE
jgi:hypothetical protein